MCRSATGRDRDAINRPCHASGLGSIPAEIEAGCRARPQAVRHDPGDLLLCLGVGDRARTKVLGGPQIDVGTHDLGDDLENDAPSRFLGGLHPRFGTLDGPAGATPQIDFPRCVETGVVDRELRVEPRDLRDGQHSVRTQPVFNGARRSADLKERSSRNGVTMRARFAKPRARLVDILVFGDGRRDQFRQQWIVQLAPPGAVDSGHIDR